MIQTHMAQAIGSTCCRTVSNTSRVLCADIDAARHFIDLETYIFAADDAGRAWPMPCNAQLRAVSRACDAGRFRVGRVASSMGGRMQVAAYQGALGSGARYRPSRCNAAG